MNQPGPYTFSFCLESEIFCKLAPEQDSGILNIQIPES